MSIVNRLGALALSGALACAAVVAAPEASAAIGRGASDSLMNEPIEDLIPAADTDSALTGSETYTLSSTTNPITVKVTYPSNGTTKLLATTYEFNPDIQMFPDVSPDEWYYDAVNAMAQMGVVSAYDYDGKFHPNDTITYGEFSRMVCMLSKYGTASLSKLDIEDYREAYGRYVDLDNAEYILALSNTSPDGETYSGMSAYSTRTPMAAINIAKRCDAMSLVYKLAYYEMGYREQLENIENGIQYSSYVKYASADPDLAIGLTAEMTEGYYSAEYEEYCKSQKIVSDYGDGYGYTDYYSMTALHSIGLLNGSGDGSLDYEGYLTRAQACQILYNLGCDTVYQPVVLDLAKG